MTKENEDKKQVGKSEEGKEKPHVCSVCARPSETVICLHCETKIRAEAYEHKHDVEKAGKID